MLPAAHFVGLYGAHSLNSTPPTFATGFDLGVMMHGLLGGKWGYNLGVFSGTGIDVNLAQKRSATTWAFRRCCMPRGWPICPKGPIPSHQGRIDDRHNDKIMFALSASYNVEG